MAPGTLVRTPLLALALAAAFAGCRHHDIGPDPGPPPRLEPSKLANPAAENCVKLGGRVAIELHPGGGEYGICLFEDNRQCEEWALMRGHCPAGGVKVAGYATPEARFCVISGGKYAVTADGGRESERGDCALPGGKTCAAADYFGGTCSAR